VYLSQCNILNDGGTGADSSTGGQETGQGDGREDNNHSHMDHELYQSEAHSGHGAEFTLG
jgi:hypothetical protein